jgi:hypothetical protein
MRGSSQARGGKKNPEKKTPFVTFILNPEKTVPKIGNGELQVEHGLAGVM